MRNLKDDVKMDLNKVSSLFNYLKHKYGEDSIRLLRKWEFIVKKMVNKRNHRRYTLRCIKVDIIPVSCKIRNPLNPKTFKRCQIKHKVGKQLLYKKSETSTGYCT